MLLDDYAANVANKLEEQAKVVDDAWQIPQREALALHQIIVAANCRSLLEIGVSYGYSTLYLAHAARINNGYVDAIEFSEKKFNAATANLTEARLIDRVTIHLGKAQEILPAMPVDTEPFDFVFIDAWKQECFEYLEAAWPKLADQCIIATDNTTTHAEELADFCKHLRSHPEIISSTAIVIGNGFELSIRRKPLAAD